jgi:hypothetical protein
MRDAGVASEVMSVVSEWRMAWEGRHGHAYDEAAFRHLLARERMRGRAAGPVVVLLVELTSSARGLDRALVARLFSTLVSCVRETDIVGWYRRERVAGVVLTETSAASVAAVSRLVGARVAEALERRLPAAVAHRVHIRIHSNRCPVAPIAAAAGLAVREDQ